MFTPGHLNRSNSPAGPGMPEFTLDVFYEARLDPGHGLLLHFKISGHVAGRAFVEEFDMPRDSAFNFASRVAKAAAKHGLPVNAGLIMRGHAEYDDMFADIRAKLGLKPGDPVDLENLEKDRF
ncbi:MAG: DUF5064 family protein [Pseudomonas sp.]|uniref:DUF5064 family protein n=1 Tax=Pseudomonas sp. TaxID=306 RepID=UPI0033931D62